MIPLSWQLVEIGEVSEVRVGIVSKPSQYYVGPENGVRAFRSANIKPGGVVDAHWVYISEAGDDANRRSKLRAGDVLVVRSGYPGTACVVPDAYVGSNAIDVLIARADPSRVLPEYLCAYTNSALGRAQITNVQGGLAQKHLNVGAYRKLRMTLPPLAEQCHIVNILSTWDRAIETAERLADNSQRQKRALMQQLLTGRHRDTAYVEPWRRVAIGDMGRVVSGGTPDTREPAYWNGDVPWATPTDIAALRTRFVWTTARTLSGRGLRASGAKLVPKGALLACTRATIGTFAVAATELATNQGLKCLIPASDFDVEFLYYLFSFHRKRFLRYASGSTFMELSKRDFERRTFVVPPLKEQRTIANLLADADDEIEASNAQLGRLRLERKALSQQLLTGKRRVRVTAAAACV